MRQLKQRTLKIEATGDFWRRRIRHNIRLCVSWLEHAGFPPGSHVRVTSPEAGKLTLQKIEPPAPEAIPPA